VSPQETIAAFLAGRFRASLPGGRIAFDDPLVSSGVIDSFGLLELIAFLEDTFRVVIDPTRLPLTEFDTVNRISAVVERARQR